MYMKIPWVRWRPSCPGGDELNLLLHIPVHNGLVHILWTLFFHICYYISSIISLSCFLLLICWTHAEVTMVTWSHYIMSYFFLRHPGETWQYDMISASLWVRSLDVIVQAIFPYHHLRCRDISRDLIGHFEWWHGTNKGDMETLVTRETWK